MRITGIEIRNFRGIHDLSIHFQVCSRVICLIGPGDSGKSTILRAIEWTLWPSWNLAATDTDFYNCDTNNPIVIQLSIAELPEALMKEDTFGLYLRDYGMVLLGQEDDEPRDGLPQVLTIRLTIDASLEPKWEIVTNRMEPKVISHKDRRVLTLGVVGSDHEKDFQWGRNSILQRYTDSRAALHDAFTTAMRNAVANTTLEALDTISPIIAGVGEKFGVAFNGQLHNKLLMQNGAYSSTVGVFDDKVPFAQRGLGSKRLLSIGMNVNTYENSSVVLIDEVETGLEPYRISALINELRKQFKDNGQVIMTTHSRSVVCECTVDELAVVHASNGETRFNALNTVESIKNNVQGLIRREPDSFLCKRVIVCEGKTEVGLLRAFDDYLLRETDSRLAYYGVGIALGGGGNNFFELAKLLKNCGYDTCILMDSDIASEEEQKAEAMSLGILVFSWEAGYAIEEQLFSDASVSCAEDLVNIAVKEKGFDSVIALMNNAFAGSEVPYQSNEGHITLNNSISTHDLARIGTLAKGKRKNGKDEGCWFKRIDLGQQVGDIVFSSQNQMKEGSNFMSQMVALREWVTRRET